MTALALDRPQRRGACPGLSAPMQTGDGLLVRLLPTGTITPGAFRHLCAAARQHGNGAIEITGRGSIQVRGLSATSTPRFAEAVAALDIAAEDGVPVLCNALAGLDAVEILDASALAGDLRRTLAQTSLAAKLAPKVSVAIDGGGALSLDGVAADVHLCAEPTRGDRVFNIAVGGDRSNAAAVAAVSAPYAVEAVMRLLELIAQHGRDARAGDVLAAEGAAPFRNALDGLVVAARSPERVNRRTTEPIGRFPLRDGSIACGVALAFGHTEAAVLERLAEAADAAGAAGLRAAPYRALMIIGLAGEAATAFAAVADDLGFIVRPDDPRRRVVACAGAPICSSAHLAARAVAPLIAETAAPQLNSAFSIHISGCGKGCAHAGKAALTIVGTSDGCAVIGNGTVRDAPFATVATDGLPAAIARFAREAKGEAGHV